MPIPLPQTKSNLVRRVAPMLAVLALCAMHIALRVRTAMAVFGSSETEPLFASSDSFCHAHRVQQLFERWPHFVFHDRFMFHPQGTIVEWPLGFDWTVASALRMMTSSWDLALWWLPWATLVISLVALGVFVATARASLGPWAALVVAACFAVNLSFVRVSTPAELDHHVVEILGVVLLLAMPLLAAAWSRGQALAFGFALAWSIWNSTLLGFLVFGFLGLWVITLQLRPAQPPKLMHFSLALLIPLLVLSSIEAHARGAYFAFNTLSLLHPLFIGVALVALEFCGAISPLTMWASAVLVAVIGVLMAPHTLTWLLQFVTAHDPIIANINESRPLFSSLDGLTLRYVHAFFGPIFLLFPVALFSQLRVHAARDDQEPSRWPAPPLQLLAFALVLFVLSLSQKRFSHLFAPALVLVVGVWAGRARRQISMLALVALLSVEPVVAFFPDTAQAIPESAYDAQRVGHALRVAADGRNDLGVSAPPNLGSAINYFSHLPVVTSAFFYPRYLRADMELRSFEKTSAFLAYMHKQRLGFLVAVDDARYRTMLLRMLGEDALATQAAQWEQAPCQGPLLRYAFDRIACGVERPPELVELMSEHLTTDRHSLWRHLRVFKLRD